MAGMLSGSVTGYVAKDPEARANGKAVGFSVPVSKGKDKPTTWVRVTCWGKTAEFVGQYIKKGSLVTCTGEIEMREYESAKGKGVSLDMSANSVTSFKAAGNEATAPAAARPMADDDFAF